MRNEGKNGIDIVQSSQAVCHGILLRARLGVKIHELRLREGPYSKFSLQSVGGPRETGHFHQHIWANDGSYSADGDMIQVKEFYGRLNSTPEMHKRKSSLLFVGE